MIKFILFISIFQIISAQQTNGCLKYDNSKCIYCQEGYGFNSETNICTLCKIGEYSIGGKEQCQSCFNHTLCTDKSEASLNQCPFYSSSEGKTKCSVSSIGKYTSVESTYSFDCDDNCRECSGGFSGGKCMKCEVGYGRNENSAVCVKCEGNEYSDGSTECRSPVHNEKWIYHKQLKGYYFNYCGNGCKFCSNEIGKCSECFDGYKMNDDESCHDGSKQDIYQRNENSFAQMRRKLEGASDEVIELNEFVGSVKDLTIMGDTSDTPNNHYVFSSHNNSQKYSFNEISEGCKNMKIKMFKYLQTQYEYLECTECYEPYVLDNETKVCLKCDSTQHYNSNTKKCEDNMIGCEMHNFDGSCLYCSEKYTLRDGKCIKATKCEKPTESTCEVCSNNVISIDGVCEEQESCLYVFNSTCIKCEDRYHYSEEEKKCVPYNNCETSNGDFCLYSDNGYRIQSLQSTQQENYGKPIQCDTSCEDCVCITADKVELGLDATKYQIDMRCNKNKYLTKDGKQCLEASQDKNCLRTNASDCMECAKGYYLSFLHKALLVLSFLSFL